MSKIAFRSELDGGGIYVVPDWWVAPIDGGEAMRTGVYAVFGPSGS
jgi:hypothetical protein